MMNTKIIKYGKHYVTRANYIEHNGKCVPKYNLTDDIKKAQPFPGLTGNKWLSYFKNIKQFKLEKREE
ncbi:MAG: hypothetical protein ACRCWQ_10575 [Bacilli bacterium]